MKALLSDGLTPAARSTGVINTNAANDDQNNGVVRQEEN
jgi:hypothetical protein